MEFTFKSRISFFCSPRSDEYYNWSQNWGNLIHFFLASTFLSHQKIFKSIWLSFAKINLIRVDLICWWIQNHGLLQRSFCQQWGMIMASSIILAIYFNFHCFCGFLFASKCWFWRNRLSFKIVFGVHWASCFKKLGFANKKIRTMSTSVPFGRNSHFQRQEDAMVKINVDKITDVWNQKVSFRCYCECCLDCAEDKPLMK